MTGEVVAIAGAIVLFLVFHEVYLSPARSALVFTVGMPGVLIIAMGAVIALVFGIHLLGTPRHAVRTWSNSAAGPERREQNMPFAGRGQSK
jgi:hypothetical protein